MTKRIKCIANDCGNTILTATAAANNGFCAPCLQKQKEEEREKYIRENRREVNLYEGVTDRVEIVRIFHTPRAHDPLIEYLQPPQPIENIYATLTGDEARRLMEIAKEARLRAPGERVRGSFVRDDSDFAEDIAKNLAMLTEYPLDNMLKAWIAKNVFWPPIIFRQASPVTRDAIIEKLESGEANANEGLLALAWIGDKTVRKAFADWDSKKAPWLKPLQTLPSKYAVQAGWELRAGQRRDLFHTECWAINPAEKGQKTDAAVQTATDVNQKCPWCAGNLSWLISIDPTDSRFSFLKVNRPAFHVLTCHGCSAFGTVFAHIRPDGTAEWIPENSKPSLVEKGDSYEPNPWSGVAITLRKRRAIEAADWCSEPQASQIGGMPTWVQSAEYPTCPRCSQTMVFVAQLDQSRFPYYEGIYYAFYCSDCAVTATTYQQS